MSCAVLHESIVLSGPAKFGPVPITESRPAKQQRSVVDQPHFGTTLGYGASHGPSAYQMNVMSYDSCRQPYLNVPGRGW